MESTRSRVSVTIWSLCALSAFAGLGWMLVSYLIGSIPGGRATAIVSELGIQVFSALFVGSSAGMIVNWYLKRAVSPEDREARLRQELQQKSGIEQIYPSRLDAAPEFLRRVQDGDVQKLDIIGISLRDFLTGGGSLHAVWQTVRRRFVDEETANLNERQRLRARLLLLDPRSSEGRFRAGAEAGTIGAVGLPFDVPAGLAEVSIVQRAIFGSRAEQHLQARLYEHCPFAFMFITEKEAFVEQYYYRDHTRGVTLPLIKYPNTAPQYNELVHSFDITWKHAGAGEMLQHFVGTAAAIEGARIKNIFSREHRNYLGKREIECISSARPGDVVRIRSITGKFYLLGSALAPLRRIASKEGGATVRFALVNPVCQQAILRAIADSCPAEELKEALCGWTWEKHVSSRLYQDAHQAISAIEHWRENGCLFDLHLYFGSIACALLLTPSAAFNEQYFYGRSRAFQENLVLGGEYPVFEFEVPEFEGEDRIELEILSSTFDVIWNSYSIRIEEYRSRDEQQDFEMNLAALLTSCGAAPQSGEESRSSDCA